MITSITRVISIIKTIFISTIKSKRKITLKKLICYIYVKIDYYKKKLYNLKSNRDR